MLCTEAHGGCTSCGIDDSDVVVWGNVAGVALLRYIYTITALHTGALNSGPGAPIEYNFSPSSHDPHQVEFFRCLELSIRESTAVSVPYLQLGHT